jgi:hypothetical protein
MSFFPRHRYRGSQRIQRAAFCLEVCVYAPVIALLIYLDITAIYGLVTK